MNISYLFRYLWKKKWLIIAPTLVAIALVWLFTRHLSPGYTSVAELSTGYMDGGLVDNSRKVNKEILFNNVIQTLHSNQVLDPVSYQLMLHDLQETAPFKDIENKAQLNNIIAQYPGGKSGLIISLRHKMDSSYVLNLAKGNDRIIRKLADMYRYSPDALIQQLQIQRIQGSDFIKIMATTTNPNLSATVSNGICQQFLALYQNRHGKASITSLDTLKKLVETKKSILDNKLKLLGSSNDLSAANSTAILSTLRNQLIQQKGNLIAARVALESVNKQIGGAGEQGSPANNNGDIITLRNNIDSLYAKYVNEGSADKKLIDQIDGLRSRLQQKLSAIGSETGMSAHDLLKQRSDLQVKINVANQTMKDLQSKIRVLEGSVQSSTAKQSVIQGIQSEIEVARQQYLQANDLYNNTLNHTLFPGNDFKQVLHASPPLYPNPSKKVKIVAFAGVGIFFVLIFLLLFFEFIDPSIKTPSYLKENLGLNLLANLKRMEMSNPPVEEIFSANGSLSSSKKGYREEVKQLRYTVENSGKRIFLVAGYHKGSGRTTVIESLAGSLSLNNRKVLLIDANFHNNTLSRKYHAEASLESLDLTSDVNAQREIKNNMVPTRDENIQLIGCGQGDYTPEEVLPRKNIFTRIREDGSAFDYIFIDCAAVSEGPGCKELLKYIDSVIVVYAADQPLTDGDKTLVDFLQQNRVNTIGAVLNRVNTYSMD